MHEEPQRAAPMSALAISMVKNEADVIEACIRHNLHHVDLFVVIDNGSTDGTRQILEALCAEGLPVLIVDDPVFGYFQSEKTTEVYRRVVPVFQPELVYLLDADEFIRAPDRLALEAVLRQVPIGGQALLPWMTHIPDPQSTTQQMLEDPLGGAPWRRKREEPLYYKAVIRRNPQDDDTLVVEQGNHAIRMSDGRAVPTVTIQGAHVAHLPVRTVDQVNVKAINGWQAYMVRNRTCHFPGQGSQWQLLYERVTRGGGIQREDISSVALDYAQTARAGWSLASDAVLDPMTPRYGRLRHLSMGRHDALAKVALSMEQHLSDEFRAAPQHAMGEPMDLATVAHALRAFHISRLVTPQGPWESGLQRVAPEMQSVKIDQAEGVFAPELDVPSIQAVAPRLVAGVARCVVTWLPAGHDSHLLDQVLSTWAEHGWEADMMQTLGLRALATYGDVRRGGLVMRPVDPARLDKAQAVKAALVAMAAQPFQWVDPQPQVVEHPLQTLTLR
jgi:hypothetical protein